jgi:hypothetical protein
MKQFRNQKIEKRKEKRNEEKKKGRGETFQPSFRNGPRPSIA